MTPHEIEERLTIGELSRLLDSYLNRKRWEAGIMLGGIAMPQRDQEILEYRKGKPVVSADTLLKMAGAI